MRRVLHKAIEVAIRTNNGSLPSFRHHLERLTAEEKGGGTKNTASP